MLDICHHIYIDILIWLRWERKCGDVTMFHDDLKKLFYNINPLIWDQNNRFFFVCGMKPFGNEDQILNGIQVYA